MKYYHHDNPQLITVDFLRELDQEEAGRWVAQPKLDGRLRVVHKDGDQIVVQAKDKEPEDSLPLPDELLRKLEESLRRTKENEFSISMEWVGLRPSPTGTHQDHQLYCLDLIRYAGTWLRKTGFLERQRLLASMGFPLLPTAANPDLVDMFYAQLTCPISEGIVVRRQNSGLCLGASRCLDNPQWFKCKHTFVNRVAQFQKGWNDHV